MRQITTLAIIENGDSVLLAMKKRGFGEGWWNGYGGKVQDNETVEEAMVRELQEESGLLATSFRERAIIEFFSKGSDSVVEMHVFEVTNHKGELIETEEMAPKWFLKQQIPFDEMWPSDREWLPLFFKGHDFDGRVVFDETTSKYLKSDFKLR